MTEYQSIAGKVLAGMPAFFEHASPASVVADVIYEAATDGTTRLRYTAGEDARETIANRLQADDASFMGMIKTQFGL